MKKISATAVNALKEALTNIYWYKADLLSFLKNSLTNRDLVGRIDQTLVKRNIVTIIVDYMATHEDLYQNDLLKLMVETIKMEDFTHLKQLEDGKSKALKAERSVEALRKLVAGYQKMIDEQEGAEEKRRIAYETSLKNKGVQERLDQLKKEYMELFSVDQQKRGYILEKILKDLFELFDLDPKASFKIAGEQIDGAFTFDTTDYLFECKWQGNLVDAANLDAFKGKLSRKLENTLGLFLSINGYSADAVAIHSKGRGMSILMDGSDLMAVLEGRIDLVQLLLRKRRYASQTGNIYLKIHEII